jgi:hypothetical protein
VSDLISRLAARAAGTAAAAHPRVPARFEGPAGPWFGVAEAGEFAARSLAGPPSDRRTSPAPANARGRDTGRRPSGPSRVGSASAEPAVPMEAVAATPPGATAERLRKVERVSERDGRRAELSAVPPSAATQVSVRAWPVVPAVPISATRLEPGSAAPVGSAESRPSAEPVVQISIGRVEVRATLAAPVPAPRPGPADRSRQPSLTLHDYLRGRRRTR